MKILVDARSLGQKPSGIGMYIYNFMNELEKYPDLSIGLLTDVSESNEMKKLGEKERVKIYAYGKVIQKGFGLRYYFEFVQKMIHEVKPDLFWEGNNLVPIKIENPYGKIATTIYDMFPLSMPECYGKIYPFYFKYGIHKTLEMVDFIIYISEETKIETEKYFLKAKTKKNFLSYIIVNIFPQSVVEDKEYFAYVGNLEKRKGTDLLLKAYKQYRMRGGKKKLFLAGKIREKDIENLYKTIKKQVGGIEYLGYINEKEKDELLAKCSCFLFPSRAEGFGIPIVEAMAYHKPIIATKLSIYQELFGDSIEYIPFHEETEFVTCLCEKMESYKKDVDLEKYSNIVYQYSAKNLSDNMYKFIVSE